MNSIFRRHSVRDYTDKAVADVTIHNILKAAMCAPSAGNERPWHFIVVKDKATLQHLSATHRHASMIARASVAIVICGDLDLEIKKSMWIQDCSAATENILIEVEELMLGAVWVGIYPREDRIEYVKKVFSLPVNIIPFSIVPIGYPAVNTDCPDRFDPSRIHYDRWK
jgi:nitroreductase